MLERLLDYEHDWFLAINNCHTWWLDGVMYAFTGVWAWAPMLLAFLYFVYKRRSEALSFLICTALTGVFNFLLTSALFKPFFTRFRPTSHPLFMDKVLKVNNFIANGDYGFISGHSTNAFAFATLSALAVGNRWYTLFIYVWALIMVYSRVYLGAHFITDVIPGIIAGTLMGWALFKLFKYLNTKIITK